MVTTEALLALMHTPGSNTRQLRVVMEWAQATETELEPLLGQVESEVIAVMPAGLSDAARLVSACNESLREEAAREWTRAREAGMQAIRVGDHDYPLSIKHALGSGAPPVLFVVGDMELLQEPGFGIAGARHSSATGLDWSRQCARLAKTFGVPVVSGGAPGVDEAAHEEALHGGASTVIVLPQGILRFRASRVCMEAIEEGRVALVSAMPPAQPFTTPGALSRNTLLCALSRLVCVIGPKEKGGSIHTARQALAQKRPLFIWCEDIHRNVSESLKRMGAEQRTCE